MKKKDKSTFILVINCGSSSLKYNLFSASDLASKASGLVERIGDSSSRLISSVPGKEKRETDFVCKDHFQAFNRVLDELVSGDGAVISSPGAITGIGHRAVHGGEKIKSSVIIDKTIIKTIEENVELAPLHNPPALNGIRAAMKALPRADHVAVFDTAFHQSIPEKAFMYALPYDMYRDKRIRKYGFHGTSHRFVAAACAKKLRTPLNRLKIVTCHLGNGCSITAVDRGRSVDTSMGFTPLPGLVMGTRSGDLDPAILIYLMKDYGLDVDSIEHILNKESGLLGISGISNDMRDLNQKISKGNSRAKLAKEMFIYRIKFYIGAYAAVMNGLDAVVLTAGIGENDRTIIKTIKGELSSFLKAFNASIMILSTNEEYLIAEDTRKLLNKKLKAKRR